MDPCYNLVADRVTPEEWGGFSRKLLYGFKGFPQDWSLSDEIREKLILKMQWQYFNPDLYEGMADKRARAWAFMASFLGEAFRRKFSYLRTRHEAPAQERWDRDFSNFENLLYLSSMDEDLQLEWLASFDARVRYGKVRRARIIKNKGLGLQSELLGVNILMTWPEIKARYRFMLKRHHPDVGGNPVLAKQIIEEFNRLTSERQPA